MKVKIQLIYPTDKQKDIEVVVKDGIKGQRFMNAIDKAVEKAAADDKEWTRWNLVSILD